MVGMIDSSTSKNCNHIKPLISFLLHLHFYSALLVCETTHKQVGIRDDNWKQKHWFSTSSKEKLRGWVCRLSQWREKKQPILQRYDRQQCERYGKISRVEEGSERYLKIQNGRSWSGWVWRGLKEKAKKAKRGPHNLCQSSYDKPSECPPWGPIKRIVREMATHTQRTDCILAVWQIYHWPYIYRTRNHQIRPSQKDLPPSFRRISTNWRWATPKVPSELGSIYPSNSIPKICACICTAIYLSTINVFIN